MSVAAIEAGFTVIEELTKLIPQWIDEARKKGELTPEQDADFQGRQAAVFAKPYAQPEHPPP